MVVGYLYSVSEVTELQGSKKSSYLENITDKLINHCLLSPKINSYVLNQCFYQSVP